MNRAHRIAAVAASIFLLSACAGAANGAKSPKAKTTTRKPTTSAPKTTKIAPVTTSLNGKPPAVKLAKIQVLRTIPKEPGTFTQGLEIHDGVLYESTGLYGQSEMRIVDLTTGKVLQRVSLDATLFAEGATVLPDGSLVQLTWREKVAVVRDTKTLAETKRFAYDEEGWGVCYSNAAKAVIHSDGSNQLLIRDPATFAKRKSIPVVDSRGKPTTSLNELECVGSSVFANVWQQDRILEINVTNGAVVREIDASSITSQVPNRGPDDVLNGVAALGKDRYLITGKRFPAYYEVVFVPTNP
jgi:glutaminyl-peptide cyclotransferase